MVRVAWLDDHPAVRAGLAVMVARRGELVGVGSAGDGRELQAMLDAAHPDVVVLDLDQAGTRGLTRLLLLHQRAPALHIVDYSAERVEESVIPAFVAGADAVVSKADTPEALFDAILGAANGQRTPSAIAPALIAEAAARLDPEDHAILTMRLAGDGLGTIARTLGLPPLVAANRAARVLAQLGTGSASHRPAAQPRASDHLGRPVLRRAPAPLRLSPAERATC